MGRVRTAPVFRSKCAAGQMDAAAIKTARRAVIATELVGGAYVIERPAGLRVRGVDTPIAGYDLPRWARLAIKTARRAVIATELVGGTYVTVCAAVRGV